MSRADPFPWVVFVHVMVVRCHSHDVPERTPSIMLASPVLLKVQLPPQLPPTFRGSLFRFV